ncbi:MAG: hypothetical protein AB2556_24370, partial [Candidatus Thiodiazotropha sp.]
PQRCPLGHILTYYDGSQPQFTHLRASMLAYAHINLLSMLLRFTPDEAVRVATDSMYISKKRRSISLRGSKHMWPPNRCNCGGRGARECILCMLGEPFLPPVAPAQWRDKGEKFYIPMEHALRQA